MGRVQIIDPFAGYAAARGGPRYTRQVPDAAGAYMLPPIGAGIANATGSIADAIRDLAREKAEDERDQKRMDAQKAMHTETLQAQKDLAQMTADFQRGEGVAERRHQREMQTDREIHEAMSAYNLYRAQRRDDLANKELAIVLERLADLRQQRSEVRMQSGSIAATEAKAKLAEEKAPMEGALKVLAELRADPRASNLESLVTSQFKDAERGTLFGKSWSGAEITSISKSAMETELQRADSIPDPDLRNAVKQSMLLDWKKQVEQLGPSARPTMQRALEAIPKIASEHKIDLSKPFDWSGAVTKYNNQLLSKEGLEMVNANKEARNARAMAERTGQDDYAEALAAVQRQRAEIGDPEADMRAQFEGYNGRGDLAGLMRGLFKFVGGGGQKRPAPSAPMTPLAPLAQPAPMQPAAPALMSATLGAPTEDPFAGYRPMSAPVPATAPAMPLNTGGDWEDQLDTFFGAGAR